MSAEEDLSELRSRSSAAQARKARAQVLLEQSQAQEDQHRKALKDEFGVETPDDARAMIAELQARVDRELAAARKKLEEAGA